MVQLSLMQMVVPLPMAGKHVNATIDAIASLVLPKINKEKVSYRGNRKIKKPDEKKKTTEPKYNIKPAEMKTHLGITHLGQCNECDLRIAIEDFTHRSGDIIHVAGDVFQANFTMVNLVTHATLFGHERS